MENSKTPILQIIDHLGPGGAQRQFVELALGLQQRGYPLLVCALDAHKTEFVQPLKSAGIEVKLIAQSGKLDIQAAKMLYQSICQFRPAIVQTWLYTADMYGRSMAYCYKRRARSDLKIISSIRSAETDKKSLYVWVDRLLRKITDQFTVNAAILGDSLQQREWVAKEKIRTIYNGIDFRYFSGGELQGSARESGPYRIIYIGRLSSEKRPELFIQAAAQCLKAREDLEFIMLGSGEAAPFQELAGQLGIQNKLHMHGFSDDIGPLLRQMDILVSCSDYEGCSNTILEAMAAGVPVVATAVGGNRELVREDAGWLVTANSAPALAQGILDALNQPGKRDAVRQLAYQRVSTEFSKAHMVEQHEQLYRQLLA